MLKFIVFQSAIISVYPRPVVSRPFSSACEATYLELSRVPLISVFAKTNPFSHRHGIRKNEPKFFPDRLGKTRLESALTRRAPIHPPFPAATPGRSRPQRLLA